MQRNRSYPRRRYGPTGTGLAVLCLGAMLAAAPCWGDTARPVMKSGLTNYQDENFNRAVEDFEKAADLAEQEGLDPARALFNRGAALYNLQDLEEAASAFRQSLKTEDLPLQSRTYYNLGNTLFSLTGQQEQEQQLDMAKQSIEQALRMYENAISLDPRDVESKINYELSLVKQQEIEEKQQQQQQQQQQEDQEQDDQEQDDQEQDEQQQDQQQDDQKDQEQQDQQQDQEQQDQQQQDQQQDDQQQQDQQQQQAPPPRPEEMTPEEAQMLLDAMREEEQAARDQIRIMLGRPVPVDKDW